MTPGEFVIVLTTLPADSEVVRFATTLVQERLAACVNVLPEIQSVYWWGGQLEQDLERQVVMKTTAARIERLRERVKELHPYEVPEFLVIPVTEGDEAYLKWVRDSTGSRESG